MGSMIPGGDPWQVWRPMNDGALIETKWDHLFEIRNVIGADGIIRITADRLKFPRWVAERRLVGVGEDFTVMPADDLWHLEVIEPECGRRIIQQIKTRFEQLNADLIVGRAYERIYIEGLEEKVVEFTDVRTIGWSLMKPLKVRRVAAIPNVDDRRVLVARMKAMLEQTQP